MNNVTILVLSRYNDLFEGFRENMDRLAPDHWKLLIRTGTEIPTPGGEYWLTRQGEEPFIFARNVNMGVKTIYPDDVLICGDDVRIFTDKFVQILQKVAYESPNIGVSTPQMYGQSPFVCGYFKRDMLEAVGGMDERFHSYGFDDMDFFRRMEALGFVTMPTLLVSAEHKGGTSFYRREKEEGINVEAGNREMRRLYAEKWGETQ